MRTLKHILLVVTAMMAITLPASAQLRFGVKAGVALNSLDVTNLDYVKDNSAGFTGGVMAEFIIPGIGLGADASLMYTRRDTPKNVYFISGDEDICVGANMTPKNFIEIPVHIKYAFKIPAIDRIVKPFIATGPGFAFNLSDKKADTEMNIHNTQVSWDLGGGVELIKHVQIGVSYRWGLGAINKDDLNWTTRNYDLKSKGWNITAAYLF